ncbi:MAG TPA: FeoB-associated Cys-rich membrane protein [Pyrinomonadaceae bacterium]|nr:FeoB-associated Cys-rich membrane protein [Pyrinomonadaceae bacterium]
MFEDWQTIAVWLIILAALAYVGRRGWARARSFRVGGKGPAASPSCASGCGSCGDGETQATRVSKPQNALVQITSAGSATRRHE